MTNPPTRAEVEALLARLRRVEEHDWRVSFLAHTSDTAREARLAITALLPLAYTETGETWLSVKNAQVGVLGEHFDECVHRAEAAERRLAEVEAELKRIREWGEEGWSHVRSHP